MSKKYATTSLNLKFADLHHVIQKSKMFNTLWYCLFVNKSRPFRQFGAERLIIDHD